jgi:hypothetical protein
LAFGYKRAGTDRHDTDKEDHMGIRLGDVPVIAGIVQMFVWSVLWSARPSASSSWADSQEAAGTNASHRDARTV